ncbi:DNA-binding transcriptional ArsR family regulator [Rhizobium aquaticum]|uniref:DNA-binding transcriptional ArsR family regulator n=1 Tax=Rhizobium aquaticum TaxID=1549636 RepID=A0ABV2IUV1_9HYPH
MSNFVSGTRIAEIGAVIGDVSRATILLTLMDGRAFSAGELAAEAGVTPQTASAHLAKLSEAGLIAVHQQGRHRYFKLASGDVAELIEVLSALIAAGPKRSRPTGPKDAAMRLARTCYDHLAGHLAVRVAESMEARGFIALSQDGASLSADGRRYVCDFGVDLEMHSMGRRALCRACLDWSERRFHIGGALGAGLLDRFIELGWLRRASSGRALTITRAGEAGFAREFGYRAGEADPMHRVAADTRRQPTVMAIE